MNQKRYSPACERNSEPIAAQLRQLFSESKTVLEIGSGTGQHAVYFATRLPHLIWHTSDRPDSHSSIHAWIDEAKLPNLVAPLSLDVNGDWPKDHFDAAFSANTCHIMAWEEVQKMFEGLSRCLVDNAFVVLYGPFNYGGHYTSESNQAFDLSLRNQSSHMGLRDQEAIVALARTFGFVITSDRAMPANNRLLVFQKTTNTLTTNKSD